MPLERALGPEMGAVCADLHRDHGVDVRLGVGVMGMDAGYDDHVERVRLSDGTAVDADLVVVGIGVVPNTDWLEGSGLELDNGVVCDATMRAAPGVVAAGDVARWPNLRFDEVMRIEHWENAVEMGAHAARTLLAGDAGGEPFMPVPWFWSDQYDRKIQLAGPCRCRRRRRGRRRVRRGAAVRRALRPQGPARRRARLQLARPGRQVPRADRARGAVQRGGR